MKYGKNVFLITMIVLLPLKADQGSRCKNDPAWLAQFKKPWAVSMICLNPFATFEPSIISGGHAQYFERVDELDYEQKKDLKKFVAQLKMVKIGFPVLAFMQALLIPYNRLIQVAATGSQSISILYAYQLHQFDKKLDESINGQKSS